MNAEIAKNYSCNSWQFLNNREAKWALEQKFFNYI